MTLFQFLLLLCAIWPTGALDIFCGSLTVYEQQRFGSNAINISSQATDDLKQCLELCCNIPNCRGVTLLGIISPRPGEPNCQLVGCRGGDCLLAPKGNFNDGVLSVVLKRDGPTQTTPQLAGTAGMDSDGRLIGAPAATPKYTTAASITIPEFFTPSRASSGDFSGFEISSTTTVPPPPDYDHNEKLSRALQPVWAVGLAIVIAVVCVGLSLGLLSAYICYKRQKNRKQRAEITRPKLPTLHAFNTAY
ncbi:unnamed protein product, partial [Mesorhabditis spiculigera]